MDRQIPFLPVRGFYQLPAPVKFDKPKRRSCLGWLFIVAGLVGLVAITVAATLSAVGWNNGRTNPTPSKPAVESVAPSQLNLPDMDDKETPEPTPTPVSDVEWL